MEARNSRSLCHRDRLAELLHLDLSNRLGGGESAIDRGACSCRFNDPEFCFCCYTGGGGEECGWDERCGNGYMRTREGRGDCKIRCEEGCGGRNRFRGSDGEVLREEGCRNGKGVGS